MAETQNISWRFETLSELKDGKLEGPMSPMLLSKEVASKLEVPLLGVLRVDFREGDYSSEYVYQKWDNKKPNKTYFDHLIIVLSGRVIVFAIDMGVSIMAIAMMCAADDLDIKVLPGTEQFIRELDEPQFRQFMSEAYAEASKYLDNILAQLRAAKALRENGTETIQQA